MHIIDYRQLTDQAKTLPTKANVALCLDTSHCLERSAALPPGLQAKLIPAYLHGQIQQLFGLPVEQLNFGYRLFEHPEQQVAHICVMKKTLVTKLREELKRNNLKLKTLLSPGACLWECYQSILIERTQSLIHANGYSYLFSSANQKLLSIQQLPISHALPGIDSITEHEEARIEGATLCLQLT